MSHCVYTAFEKYYKFHTNRWLKPGSFELYYGIKSIYQDENQPTFGAVAVILIDTLSSIHNLDVEVFHHPDFDAKSWMQFATTELEKSAVRLADFGTANIHQGPGIFCLMRDFHAEFNINKPDLMPVLSFKFKEK